MKKYMKNTLKVLIGIFGLLVILAVAYMILFKHETGKMTPVETGKVVDNICAVQDGFVNFYLIESNGRYIAIDAGNDAEHVKAELEKLHIDPRNITAVFVTHADADHTAAIGLFTNATVYISRDEEQMINGTTARFLFVHNKLESAVTLVNPGQELNINGLRIKAVDCTGHTPGSMCYAIADNYLFTGDTMSLKEGKVEPFNKFFNMDSGKQELTLKKLAKLKDLKYIFTAHYGISGNPVEAFKEWK